MKVIRHGLCILAAMAGAASSAQERVPVTPSELQGPLPDAVERVRRAPGAALEQPLGAVNDAVPLPERARKVAGADADSVAAPAAGDPFFLAFAGGRRHPPSDERFAPELLAALNPVPMDGRPGAFTYAFVMFQKRITPERRAELEALGARVLGFHPHYCLKVALPVTAVDQVAALDFVCWIGVPTAQQKVHPRLAQELATATAGEPIAVYIDVFESDLNPGSTSIEVGSVEEIAPGNAPFPALTAERGRIWRSRGWQERALEALGVEIRAYVDSIQAFQARVTPAALGSILALDFVQFVELDLPVEAEHDESTPMISADATRPYYDGATSLAVTAGQIDSGIDHNHAMLNHTFGVGWDFGASSSGSWNDQCGHGSHVNGTLLGLDPNRPELAGVAPGLGWGNTGFFFNVKFLEPDLIGNCVNGGGTAHATLYGAIDSDFVNGAGQVTPKPMVVNNSWGTPPVEGTGWWGSEANARTLDDVVYDNRQMYVFAAGNNGDGDDGVGKEIGLPAVAKNAFTVGNVVDYDSTAANDGGQASGLPGGLWDSSSRGPCRDDRWKPNICAPGRWIRSALAGTASSTVLKSGTSMAAPHVAGVAAQLMDAYAWLRYEPERIASLLMATAVTKDNQTLSGPSTSSLHHFNKYGAGRVEAYRALWNTAQFDTTDYGFVQTQFGWHSGNFDVPQGTTRLVVCMHYVEESSGAGADPALVNDLDLWIDRDPIDPAGNTGDYFAQQSAIDNTEIRIIDNPSVGAWRWKVYPESVVSSCYVGLTVMLVRGDTTPNASLLLDADTTCVRPNEVVALSATVGTPDTLASAVYLEATTAGATLLTSSTTLADGAVTDLSSNQQDGEAVLLGDVVHGETRTATWTARWANEGVKVFRVDLVSDNADDEFTTRNITVDGTAPPLPQNLISTTHTVSVWTNVRDIDFIWAQSPDNLCGMAGYGISTTQNGPGLPSAVPDLVFVTHYEETLPLASGFYWFNLRPYDQVDNWQAGFATFGPIWLDVQQPQYVTGLTSTTHVTGALSCNDTITMQWDPVADDLSGIAGFNAVWDHQAITVLDNTLVLLGNPTEATFTLASSAQPWYFHIRPVDNAGNGQNVFHAGPYYVNTSPVGTYCVAKVNSQGCTPAIDFSGAPSTSGPDAFHVTASQVLNKKNGLLFWSQQPANQPFQGGTLCAHLPVVRTAVQSSGGSLAGTDCTGTFDYHWTQAYSAAHGLGVGSPVYAQYWYRDPASPSATGLTDAVAFTLCQG